MIKTYGSSIGFMQLRWVLMLKWAPKGEVTMIDVGNDFYYDHGWWRVIYLTIQRWRPDFVAEEKNIRYLAAWIQSSNLSMEYFDGQILSQIGKHLGKVLKIDRTIAKGERSKYTRMCGN
ncbi:hypothetical protein V2J09_007102 [Rumex salicifolius]